MLFSSFTFTDTNTVPSVIFAKLNPITVILEATPDVASVTGVVPKFGCTFVLKLVAIFYPNTNTF